MALNTLKMIVSAANNTPILLGNTSSFKVNIQNTSTTDKLYNLTLSFTLPDGLELYSATQNYTTSVTNADKSTTYSWVNIKDLSPMEINYTFSITVKCNTTFKSGAVVPFNYIFSGVSLKASVDTMPRGIYDASNQVFTATSTLSFTAVSYNGTITTSSKVLKGAGTSLLINDASQIYTSTVMLSNNQYSESTVNVSILLEDGIRYLENFIASGTDASKFTSPIVNRIFLDGKYYIELSFGAVVLSKGGSTTLTFNYAVWNKYDNNTGSLITHGTKLNMYVRMGASSSSYVVNNSFAFSAMDLIITTDLDYYYVDIGYSLKYAYTFTVGGYYNLSDVVVDYYIPDGIDYVSSSISPNSVVDSAERQGYVLTYNFPYKGVNTSTTVTIDALVSDYYRYKFDASSNALPIVAFDDFNAIVLIYDNAFDIPMNVSDTANVACKVNIGSINKQFIKAYYRDGTPKTTSALAPNDLVEYTLNYDADTLNAIQKQVSIADFFPLAASPIDNLTYNYGGYNPISSPELISPHGVGFYYGDIPGNSNASINFKVPISSLGSPFENINLMKLTVVNTEGYSYSIRDQVTVNIGTPNLKLTKSVAGPNKTAIQASEVYTYTVKIENTNTLGTETDAFSFTLIDALSPWFTLNPSSISVTGTGTYSSYNYTAASINVLISALNPGSYLTLTYSVTINNNIAPGVTITTAATNTNPYSQPYNSSSTNFQYTNLIKTASTTLSSKAVTIAKTSNTSVFKVGSNILYTITVKVPIGTILYNLVVTDTLPTGQSYLGPANKNGVLITPQASSTTITFPTESMIDARTTSQTIVYSFSCKINDAIKTAPSYTTNQINKGSCTYRQGSVTGTSKTVSSSITVVVNHPNITLSLLATDLTTSISSTTSLSIGGNSKILFNLSMYNNSLIDLINGQVEIPVIPEYTFLSIDSTSMCSAYYDVASSKIIVTIPKLQSKQYGDLKFTLQAKSPLPGNITLNTRALCTKYYNDVTTTKVYGGEISNTIICTILASLSLVPDPRTQIKADTSYTITQPGNTAVINNYFTNTGGGTDSFNISLPPALLDYSIYIDNVKVADVPKLTAYSANLDALKNVPSEGKKTITINCYIPETSPLGTRYDFDVTVKSLTSPYPSKTVYNIDPN